ncbi:MAG: hypothetical protein M3176_07065 [Chloroflexota bacterium]|nr:hypothetical protein [Chloroflexota bacterium]
MAALHRTSLPDSPLSYSRYYSLTPIKIRSDVLAPLHSTATFPVPGAVVVPMVQVHVALPAVSVIFGLKPAGCATLPSGIV